jgi:hypothetical protein
MAAVAPQGALGRGVHPQALGEHGQQVVAVGVGEVAGADLGAEVPAVERGGRVGDAADLQRHVADGRHRVPAQPQLGEPGELGVHQGHLQHGVARQLVQLRLGVAGGDQQRQDVEPPGGSGRRQPSSTARSVKAVYRPSPRTSPRACGGRRSG